MDEVVLATGSEAVIDQFVEAKRIGSTGRFICLDMTDEMIARRIEDVRCRK